MITTTIYLCPADKKYGCTWEGSSDDIYEHFSQEHEELLYLTQTVNVSLMVNSENRLLFFDNEIYLLQTKIYDDCLHIFLRFLGPDRIASNLSFDVEISADGVKIAKQDIDTRNGYFSITLECIQSCLGEVDSVRCKILVSGDFSAASPDYSLAVEPPRSPQELQQNGSDTSPSSSLNLEDFFRSPKEGNSPELETRLKKASLDESHRFTWNGHSKAEPKKESNSLTRSQTFTSEDIKKFGSLKRYGSVRSLGAIPENDVDFEPKCSNCNDHLAAPIFICLSKHNICANCFRDRKSCNRCGEEITTIRNVDLESKFSNHKYTCINRKNGCLLSLPYPVIIEHEVNCMFCEYVCPMEICGGMKAPYKIMVNHLKLIHSSVNILDSFIAIFHKHQEVFLINENMGIFYCSWAQVDNQVVWKAKFCGPKARKFFCELKFKGKNFKKPLLLTQFEEVYKRSLSVDELKRYKVKAKHSILTITR